MAVVANISVLLSARIEGYRSQIGFARRDNESFARSAAAAGLSIRDAGKAMDALRQRSFEALSLQNKYNEEMKAIGHLYRSGVLDAQNYARAVNDLTSAYTSKAAAEAAKNQDSFNSAVQRGTQLLRPQIAAQREAAATYKQTIASLQALQSSGTAARLGITSEEIEAKRREAFLTAQAKFQGRETPAQLQEQTRAATEAATAAVTKFNQRFVSARQALRNTIADLRVLREQAELAGRPLDVESQRKFIEQAKEQFRRDTGLDERIRREARAMVENNAAVERGLTLLDKNIAARRKFTQALKDIQAAVKADPQRFTGQQVDDARLQAFEAYKAETQRSTQEAAASVDRFNQRFVTAKQRLREAINELRVLRTQAAQTGKALDIDAQRAFIKQAQEQFRRDSGLDDQLKAEEKAKEEANRATERGLSLVDKDYAAKQRYQQKLADITAAESKYAATLGRQAFNDARRVAQEVLDFETTGKETTAQQVARQQAEAATVRKRIEQENIAAIQATLTADQRRAEQTTALQADIAAGLNAEAAARRALQIAAEYNQSKGVDAQQRIQAEILDRYNQAVQRGIELANPAKRATDEYRQKVKDLNKALHEAKINQEQYNLARLQAQRVRQDTSIDPIIQSGVQQIAPYKQILQQVTRNIIDMRAAVQAGAATQKQYNQALSSSISPTQQYVEVMKRLIAAFRSGKISQLEFASATRDARTQIFGNTTAIQKLTSSLGVFRTVMIGMAGAQIYSGIFTAISDAFEFEPKVRRAIALFGEIDQAQKDALRRAVVTSTFNNVPILERVQVLEELAKDGVAADVAAKSLDRTLQFASVSGLNAADSVAKISEVMNAYRLETGNAARDTSVLYQIMDTLQFAAGQTGSTVEQLAEQLIRAAPQANILGESLRDTLRAGIGLSEIGIKGDTAGNELGIALRDLAQKAIENRQAFEDLGISVFDNDENFVGMTVTIRQLADAFSKMTPVQRVTALETLGITQKSAKFQQQLISMIDVMEQAQVTFEETDGTVERLHKESMTQLVYLTNQVKSAFTQIVNSTIVVFLEMLALQINRMGRENRSFWAGFAGLVLLATAALASLSTVVGIVAAAMWVYTTAVRAATFAQAGLLALSGPKGWLLLAGGVAAAAGAWYGMSEAWDYMEETMANTPGMEAARQQIDALKNEMDAATKNVNEMGDAVAGIDVTAITRLREELGRIKDEVRTPLESAVAELEKLSRIKEANIGLTPVIERRKVQRIISQLTGEVEQAAQQSVARLNVAAEIRGSAAEFSSRVTVRGDNRERNEQREFQLGSLRLSQAQVTSLEDIRVLLEQQLAEARVREESSIGEY